MKTKGNLNLWFAEMCIGSIDSDVGLVTESENNRNMFVFLLMTETDSSCACRTIEFGIQTETTLITFLESVIMCHCVFLCRLNL